MEETLGKRIAANRKRLGITQDRLAALIEKKSKNPLNQEDFV